MKRGYFVHFCGDTRGVAVVAMRGTDAKAIARNHPPLEDMEYIHLRANWVCGSRVDDLSVGTIVDDMDAPRRGIFSSLEYGTCDRCGVEDEYVVESDGQVLCVDCAIPSTSPEPLYSTGDKDSSVQSAQ